MDNFDINKIGAFILALRSYPELSEKLNECAENNNDIGCVKKIIDNLNSEYAASFERAVDFWEEKLTSLDNSTFEELRNEYNKRLIADHSFMIGNKSEASEDTIIRRIAKIAEQFPEKTALTDKNGSVTYREFWNRVNSCACFLSENSVEKDDVIAIEVCNNVETVVKMTAVMLLGAVYIPYDSKSPTERKKYIITEGGAKYIMPLEGSEALGKKLLQFKSDPEFSGRADIVQEHDSRCYIIFTSGTTGKPKGVAIREYQLSNLLDWYIDTLKINSDTVFFAMHSFAFDTMFKNTYAPLCKGGKVLINYDNEYDLGLICKYIEENGCTHIKSNASVFDALLNASKYDEYRAFRSVKYLFLGGDKFVGENLSDFINITEGDICLMNAYGPTEATDVSAYHIVSNKELDGIHEKNVPIGIPINNQNIYVVSRTGYICGKGIEGEMVIGGIGIAKGYEGQSNSESFSDKLISGDKTYSSGDYAIWNADGELEFCGRKDDMVKIHGYRIFLSEIENAAQKLSAVVETKAVCTNDSIVLFCRTSENENNIEDKLKAVLSQNITSYMMPSKIVFLKEFPRNLNGKTDVEKLCTMVDAEEVDEEIYSGEIQKKVTEIWCNILKRNTIGINVSFFDAGGNSLNLFMLSKKIEKEFSVKIKPVEFIKVSTIRQISELIESML